jgi:hypothetical protein
MSTKRKPIDTKDVKDKKVCTRITTPNPLAVNVVVGIVVKYLDRTSVARVCQVNRTLRALNVDVLWRRVPRFEHQPRELKRKVQSLPRTVRDRITDFATYHEVIELLALESPTPRPNPVPQLIRSGVYHQCVSRIIDLFEYIDGDHYTPLQAAFFIRHCPKTPLWYSAVAAHVNTVDELGLAFHSHPRAGRPNHEMNINAVRRFMLESFHFLESIQITITDDLADGGARDNCNDLERRFPFFVYKRTSASLYTLHFTCPHRDLLGVSLPYSNRDHLNLPLFSQQPLL